MFQTTVESTAAPASVNPDRLLPMPDERWTLCRNIGCEEADRIFLQNGRGLVGIWLQRVKMDWRKLSEMRGVLGQGFLPWPSAQLVLARRDISR